MAPVVHGVAGALGSLEVRDAAGRRLGWAAFEDPRVRSIALPDGGGAAARLERAVGRTEVDWPVGAVSVRLGGQEARPAAPPPPRAGVVAVQHAGPAAERLDLLFLGDGYGAAEQDRFAADVDALVGYLSAIEPFGAYTSLLNIWRVDEISVDSGVSHPDLGVTRETAYDCYYGCGGIERLVCCDDAQVLSTAGEVGPVEGIVVLVNDAEYGGSGGFTYATAYNGEEGLEVAAHELGHSLVLLRDEYSYEIGSYSGFTGSNCSASGDDLSWAHWLGVDGVGAFEVCSYDNFWRPTENHCMMRTLRDNYCPVCREAAVLALYQRIPDLLASAEPAAGALVDATGDDDPLIRIETLVPADQLTFEWSVNGEIVPGLSGPEVRPRCQPELTGELTVRVVDPTPWVREDPNDLLQSTAGPWTVTAARCGGPPSEGARCGCRTASPDALSLALFGVLIRRRRAA